MRVYASALGIRGDMLYCPLPLVIDSYWTCEPSCLHCFARRLNRTWGNDFRAADVSAIKKKLLSPRGKSPLSQAIKLRKTIRLGNRTDPFQDCELKYGISTDIVKFLVAEKWDMVIQTKFPQRGWDLTGMGESCSLMPVVTVGLEEDWEMFERRKTENPVERIRTAGRAKKAGFRVGINGEPFIPGHHTLRQFRETIKLLKSYGINRYSTYNLHLNDLVAKNLYNAGLDIEKIWYMNQDEQWRKILKKLIDIAERHDIILGCPDFVNSGWKYIQRCNTCCGLDVKNPCTFNAHHFKIATQEGRDPLEMWDGVGDFEEGKKIIEGTTEKMYTMKDIVGEEGEKKGRLL